MLSSACQVDLRCLLSYSLSELLIFKLVNKFGFTKMMSLRALEILYDISLISLSFMCFLTGHVAFLPNLAICVSRAIKLHFTLYNFAMLE